MDQDISQGERNEQVSAAPQPVTVNGRTLLVSPITDQIFGSLHGHLRKKLQDPLQSIAADLQGLPPHIQRMAVEAAVALKSGGGAQLTGAYIAEQLGQPDGCAYLTWLLARPNHPGLTLEEIRKAIPDEAAADAVLAQLYEAAGVGVLAGKAAGRRRS